MYNRAKFNKAKQSKSEPVDSIITSPFTLAEHCLYGELRNKLIQGRHVVGLLDSELSEKLQLDSNLTLKAAIQKVGKIKG